MAKIVNFYPVGIQTFSNIREGNYRLRCGSPWMAHQACKPKDHHRTVHVFQ